MCRKRPEDFQIPGEDFDMSLSKNEQYVLNCVLDASVSPNRLKRRLHSSHSDTLLEQLQEAFLQMHLFVGYPAMIEALRILYENQKSDSSSAGKEKERQDFDERGEAFCRTVYGDQYEALMKSMKSYHPDLPVWILRDGYGRVLAREGLSGRVRELISVLLLAYTGFSAQLRSHLRGAIHLGASKADLREVQNLIEEHSSAELSSEVANEFNQLLEQSF